MSTDDLFINLNNNCLVFIETGRNLQCTLGSFNNSHSSDCIDGTFADRQNPMLLHVLVIADSWIKVTQHFFFLPLWHFQLPFSFWSSKGNAMEGSGRCNITMICGSCEPNSIPPLVSLFRRPSTWHKLRTSVFSCTQSVICASGLSVLWACWAVLKPVLPVKHSLFAWDVLQEFKCRSLYERQQAAEELLHVLLDHDSGGVRAIGYLERWFVGLRCDPLHDTRQLMFRRNLMHNDKATAASQERGKPPQYCRHTITSEHFSCCCFFAVTTQHADSTALL